MYRDGGAETVGCGNLEGNALCRGIINVHLLIFLVAVIRQRLQVRKLFSYSRERRICSNATGSLELRRGYLYLLHRGWGSLAIEVVDGVHSYIMSRAIILPANPEKQGFAHRCVSAVGFT